MKRKALVFLTISSMILSQAAFGFAATINDPDTSLGQANHEQEGMNDVHSKKDNPSTQDASVDGMITTKKASSDGGDGGDGGDSEDDFVGSGLDFLISEKLTMRVNAGKTELSVSDLTVENNMQIGIIELSNIKIKGSGEWVLAYKDEIISDGVIAGENGICKYFANKPADTKEFYLAVKTTETNNCVGKEQDVSNGGEKACNYTGNFVETKGSAITVPFIGHTSMITEKIESEKAAEVVVTVSQVKAATDNVTDEDTAE